MRSLVFFLSLCIGAMLIGGALTTPSIRSGWYAALSRPAWNPPDWVFGPVWTALFLAMGVAASMAWSAGHGRRPWIAMALFFAQLAANVLWSGLFFGLKRVDLALADIGLLWILILATLLAFWRLRPLAGLLLVPYLAWVSYAAALNAAIWRLNAGLGR